MKALPFTAYGALLAFLAACPAHAMHPMPQPGAVLTTTGALWGFHLGMVADREERYAETAAAQYLVADSTVLELDHTSSAWQAAFQYFPSHNVSAGVGGRRRTVVQVMPGSEQFGEERRRHLISAYQAGPVCTYWRNGPDYNLAFTVSASYAAGTLHRVPVLSDVAYADSAWVPALAVPADITGFGVGLQAELFKFSRNGLCASLGAGIDYARYRVPAVPGAAYPQAVDCGNVSVSVSLGYATRVWQSGGR